MFEVEVVVEGIVYVKKLEQIGLREFFSGSLK
jgi:hypothetical protein